MAIPIITPVPSGFQYAYTLADTPTGAADAGSISDSITTDLPLDPLVTVSVLGPAILIVFTLLLPASDLVILNGIIASTPGTTQVSSGIFQGSGPPNGVVTADPGSIYQNTDGGVGISLWVKESGRGNIGWVSK